MKKTFFLLSLLCLGCLPVFLNAQINYLSGKVFYKVKNDHNVELPVFHEGECKPASLMNHPELLQIIANHSVSANIKPFKTNSPEVQRIYELSIPDDQDADLLVRELSALSYIEYAERMPIYHTHYEPNDINLTQWGLYKIQPAGAWDISTGSADVVVCIVDDAVKLNHEDLEASIWVNPGEIDGNGIDDDGNGYIDDIHGYDFAEDDNDPSPPPGASNWAFTHGTHTAGLSAATTDNGKGMASIGFSVKIMAAKTKLDSTIGTSGLQYTVYGVDYAIANHADVVNMSFGGGGFSFTYQTLITTGFNNGVTFVASAGNDGNFVQSFPASYDNVISVGATRSSDAKSGFSNYHYSVDVMAPGSGIYSCLAGSPSSYGNMSGTSMSSPITAGLCALMISADTSLTPTDVETCLESGCDNIDVYNSAYVGKIGAGRINATNSLLCLTATSVENQQNIRWEGYALDRPYPNPASDGFTIGGAFSDAQDISIHLIGVDGRDNGEVFRGEVPAGQFQKHLDLPTDLASGMYLLKWQMESGTEVQRIQVIR